MTYPIKVEVINTDGLSLWTSGELLDNNLICLGMETDEDGDIWATVQNSYECVMVISAKRLQFI